MYRGQLLDIGGESTRRGARQPGLDEELARVLPVLRPAVTRGVPVSVDTSRPEVMRAPLDTGVDPSLIHVLLPRQIDVLNAPSVTDTHKKQRKNDTHTSITLAI